MPTALDEVEAAGDPEVVVTVDQHVVLKTPARVHHFAESPCRTSQSHQSVAPVSSVSPRCTTECSIWAAAQPGVRTTSLIV
jgi:hypothetical protein